MGTPYTAVYEKALFRFRDYSFPALNEVDVSDVLKFYLNSAISDFATICKEDLSVDSAESTAFKSDLSEEVQEILALGISFYWLSAQVLNEDLLRNSLSTKDYTYFSPANLLREAQALRDSVRKEYRDKMNLYTYRHGDISSLSVENTQ